MKILLKHLSWRMKVAVKDFAIGLILGILILGVILGILNSTSSTWDCSRKKPFLWFNPTHSIGMFIGCTLKEVG